MRFDEPTSALAPEVVSEALDVMVALGREGITMMAMLYEVGFARTVMQCVVFVDAVEEVEDAARDAFFEDAARADALIGYVDALTRFAVPTFADDSCLTGPPSALLRWDSGAARLASRDRGRGPIRI